MKKEKQIKERKLELDIKGLHIGFYKWGPSFYFAVENGSGKVGFRKGSNFWWGFYFIMSFKPFSIQCYYHNGRKNKMISFIRINLLK